jgi:protein subunit release factor A
MSDEIPHDELSITVWPERSGGQQCGVSNGVKIEHLPSGLVAICNTERSQHRNKAIAMDMILGGLTSPAFRDWAKPDNWKPAP